MRKPMLMAFVLLLSSTTMLIAQTKTNITVQVGGLGCSSAVGSNMFSAFSWELNASSSPNPAVVVKPLISELSVTKQFDECSAALFRAVMTAKHLTSVTLTQFEPPIAAPSADAVATPPAPLMTVTLKDPTVTRYDLSGNQNNPFPSEAIAFGFSSITIRNLQNGSSFCFNIRTLTPC